jgi:hypothetical protein
VIALAVMRAVQESPVPIEVPAATTDGDDGEPPDDAIADDELGPANGELEPADEPLDEPPVEPR